MFVKFYSVALLASLAAALKCPKQTSPEFETENLLAEAHSSAVAMEGIWGNIGDQSVTAVDPCIKIDNQWECLNSPYLCMYRDTAHECVKV